MSLIDEYPAEYCLALETAYGQGMMSEGGDSGIEDMFSGISLSGKNALDIGSGLGGIAVYLAKYHDMKVTGCDINPWMVNESTQRIAPELQAKVDFIQIKNNKLPFESNHFDLIYSKGVFTHIQNKQSIFQEANRILKPNGYFVIMDWLSPKQNQWGFIIRKMAETENLTLFAQTSENYILDLQHAGFHNIVMRDESSQYAKYNHSIYHSLMNNKKNIFIKKYGQKILEEHANGYALIAKAIEIKEVLVKHFIARKAQD